MHHQGTALLPSLIYRPLVTPTSKLNLQSRFPPPAWRQVIAKCETRQSLFNFRTLVDAADAIIISRGNLGLDVVRACMLALNGLPACVAAAASPGTCMLRALFGRPAAGA